MMKMFKALTGLAVVGAVAAAIWGFTTHRDFSSRPHHVTSESCQDCHQSHYESWRDNTLHPKMFHPVDGPIEIVADWSKADPEIVKFSKDDIQFVIGNKWEQVYARMIDGEYYPLTAKWMITTQKWVPYKVKDWKDTPLSVKCNGCHTTGFNPETYTFSEFGIGCEACHGPGSTHVARSRGSADPQCAICHEKNAAEWDSGIISSVNSAVCGQCHTRGTQQRDDEHIQTTFDFPLNVTPGDMPGETFQPMTQDRDKKEQFWWGIGLSKNRHQEFADFSASKHGRALELLRERHTPDRGKLTDACLSCHSADHILANDGEKPTLNTATQGLTCPVCHEPHGFDHAKWGNTTPPQQKCGICHVDSISFKAGARGQQHYPGPPSSKGCPDCHMPYIVESGGAFPIRSHAFRIVPPLATRDYGVPNSCQNGGCHADKPLDWAIAEFDKFYGSGRVGDEVVVKACGGCHRVFDQAAQPVETWRRVMSTLDTHYGVQVKLEPDVQAHVLDYLTRDAP
ncbi:MAG: cytochrome C [Alphaproteobacteria bacterium]|nr:cytochrome C [Alphaproteobacteria bacterium]MBF0250015.1 cytochrome C [Alphaproteobacteria bacterium]